MVLGHQAEPGPRPSARLWVTLTVLLDVAVLSQSSYSPSPLSIAELLWQIDGEENGSPRIRSLQLLG